MNSAVQRIILIQCLTLTFYLEPQIEDLLVAEQIGTIMGDSDSENEGSQTNVNRLVIRPPGHTGDMELNINEVICI